MRVFARLGLCLYFFIVAAALGQPALGAGDRDIEPAPGPSRSVVTHQPRAQGGLGVPRAESNDPRTLPELTARLMERQLGQYRLMTIDGGGVRGAFPAQVICYLEKSIREDLLTMVPEGDAATRTYIMELPFAAHFQGGFTGTSTGSFISLGLARQNPLEPEKIIDFYREKSATIFPSPCQWQRTGLCCYPGCCALEAAWAAHAPGACGDGSRGSWRQRLWCVATSLATGCGGCGLFYNCDGLCGPRYGRSALDQELAAIFGQETLDTARVPVQATTYNLKTGQVEYLGSTGPEAPLRTLVDAARCSSAAPTFLAGVRLGQRPGAPKFVGVDGGIFENNPTAAGLRQAVENMRWNLRRFPAINLEVNAHEFFVVSLGTGQREVPERLSHLQHAGALSWAAPAIEIGMDGGSHALNRSLEGILGTRQYIRFQGLLPENLMAMDAPGNVPALLDAAHQFCQGTGAAKIQAVADYIAQEHTLSMKVRHYFGGLNRASYAPIVKYFIRGFSGEIKDLSAQLKRHANLLPAQLKEAVENPISRRHLQAFLGALDLPRELWQFQFFIRALKTEISKRLDDIMARSYEESLV